MTSQTALDPAALVASLPLETKVRLLTGATAFTLAPEESIGLGEVRLSDGPTGVRGLKFSGGRTVALFPNATLLASAWSEESTTEVGRLLAEEALAQQIHVVLGPTINLHRSVLGGRLFEAYSEDPLLTGRLAAAYVRGLQDLGVGACLKHLVANESETERNTMNSVVDPATLRELYLLPFEIAVDESDPWSVMAAYNDVNGVPATEHHHVVNEVLKGEWGYTGLVMSDWFATRTAAPAAAGGLDLVMPGPDGPWGDALVAAVRSGELDESVVDDHLRRLLVLAARVGALGDLRDYPDDLPAPDSAVRREQLTRLAAAGMTVLTNADDTLPLARGTRVALVGRHALETIDMGGGSATVNPPYQVSVAEGLTALLGDAVDVVDGVEVRTRPVPARPGFVVDPDTGRPGLHLTLLAADGTVLDERHDAPSTVMVGFDDDFPQAVARVRFRARVAGEGALEVGAIGVGRWQVTAGGTELAWTLATSGTGFAEEMLAPPTRTDQVHVGSDAVVDATVVLRSSTRSVTVGDADPGTDAGAAAEPLAGVGLFGLVARPAPEAEDDVITRAAAAAAQADVAVVVVGLTEEEETESVDKSTIALPGAQDALVRAVAAAARRTVVVVNAATPVLMPWLDDVDAVLWAGLPGQEGGHAVAAALLGDQEPTGRLVTTFPAADGAAPAWSVTPVDGDLEYTEGRFVGYRGHWADRAPAPAFWLGHGLGYATWEYADATLDTDGDAPAVTVTVTNTGARTSREVVQVYLEPASSDEPVRLVGWADATVDAGASARVTVTADARMWRRWDEAAGGWSRLADGGRLLVARGLGDVRATLALPTA
ncbi:beta-glucosidase family protein [Cellulomonas biazotea]|uniref:Cellobiase n=1 Tax=Cellulomonas biazotea TaxID=1709 RepID=O51843_9CELL|nr:glycoside hydrolase family 3 C-terminal domain-containing protein [Cellulomonas biazotea]AAC38196.1 cellobiase [Cellulomonas biazotea]GCE76960.1 glycosyl hydrolase [Cellulomonas biazotea]